MFEASHVERVIRHLVRFGSSRADAEDLAQEALVIAWRKRGEHDRARSLDAWLYGIARNVYRNHARSQRRRTMTDEPPEPAADARDLADAVAFRDALGALPETQQDIVILHELEEYTLKETAELLAIPFDTAKDRLRRARESLRERMRVDVAAAAASERRASSQLAKAAAPAVLVGVLSALSHDAAAAGAGAAAGATATSSASAPTASAGGVGAIASKLVLAGMLAAGVAIGVVADRVIARGTRAAASEPGPSATPHPADQVATPSPRPGSPDAAPRALAPDGPAAHLATTAPRTAPPPAAPTSAAPHPEVLLIERARLALDHGLADEAIRTLMRHERRFPHGQLAEERDILLVEAYLAAGKPQLARARLEHYQATYPNGLHAKRAAEAARQLDRQAPR